MYFWEANLRSLQQLLFSPTGIALCVLGLIVALAAIRTQWVYVGLVALLLFSTMTSPQSEVVIGGGYVPIMQPFESVRQNSRVFTVLVLLAAVPGTLARVRLSAGRSRGTIALVLFQVFLLGLDVLSGAPAAKSALSALTIIMVWLVLTAHPMADRHDWYQAWRPLVYACLLFVGVNLLLVAAGSPGLLGGKRFQGYTSNPQFTAFNMALCAIVFAGVASDPALRRACRIPWLLAVGTAAMAVAFAGWTGSRGGAIVGAVGIAGLYGRKLGRAGLFGLLAGVGSFMIVQWLSSSDDGQVVNAVTRVFDFSTNSRQGPWAQLWSDFMQAPVFGRGQQMEAEFSESSFLLLAARHGLVGLIPLVVAVSLLLVDGFRATWQLRGLPGVTLSHRLPFGILLAISVGAMAEAFLLGQFHILVYAVFLAASLGTLAVPAFHDAAVDPTYLEGEYLPDGYPAASPH